MCLRWPLKRFSHGPLSNIMLGHGLQSLSKHMKKRARAREAEREAAGGGDIFFMRTPEDVSGKDGELVLFEYMEVGVAVGPAAIYWHLAVCVA